MERIVKSYQMSVVKKRASYMESLKASRKCILILIDIMLINLFYKLNIVFKGSDRDKIIFKLEDIMPECA